YWIKCCKCVAEKLTTFTSGSALARVDSIYLKYAISHDQEVINVVVAQTTCFLTLICHYQNELLQLTGVGPELGVVNMTEKDVGEINSWMEELLCSTMGGFEDVITTYHSQGFMIQQQ
ncbi:hypothetical protein L208DRAFT_1260590, partial [Tricholoma matsutake]